MIAADIADELLRLVAPVLVASKAWRARERWPLAVAVIKKESRTVTSRGDFAGFLAANGLHASARECITRRVSRGSILCWVELDDDDVACAEFCVLDVSGTLRSAQ